jgi:hypothetical protein
MHVNVGMTQIIVKREGAQIMLRPTQVKSAPV